MKEAKHMKRTASGGKGGGPGSGPAAFNAVKKTASNKPGGIRAWAKPVRIPFPHAV